MYMFKGKFTDKISNLFADPRTNNPNPPPAPPPPDSPPPLDHSQARPHSMGGKSLYSYFSHIIPSVGFGGFRSNKQQSDVLPNQLLPNSGTNEVSRCQDELLDIYEDCSPAYERKETPTTCGEDKELSIISKNKGTLNNHEDNEEPTSGRSTSDSDIFEEASEPQSPEKSMSNLTDDSAFITPELYEFLESSLPNIVRGCQWILLYSTLKHGISLRTLIRKSAGLTGPCLLIVGDMQGAVFGGLLECPLKPTPKRKYQGTNQTFVFTTIYGAPRLFRPTGANRYFYLCLNDLLALGGGEHFALCLDGELLSGSSGPCDTFGNLCLARSPEFELKNVELWGFTHSSQYLT